MNIILHSREVFLSENPSAFSILGGDCIEWEGTDTMCSLTLT